MFTTFLQGIVVGVANIIPGVSGGTMALVLGIYERLIGALHTISLQTVLVILRAFRLDAASRRDLVAEFKRIDAAFLVWLGAGAVGAVVLLANLMTYLLERQHDPTYGFFFGLVAWSALVPLRLIRRKTWRVWLAALIAAAGVVALSASMSSDAHLKKAQTKAAIHTEAVAAPQAGSAGAHTPGHLLFLFAAGAIAISAMILPGISGSFLLLVMGGYFEMLKAIAYRDWIILAVFSLGCGLGLLAFTRFLNWLLKRWHDVTMGFLLGLVLGSLWAIWPFKHSTLVAGETIYLGNRWPSVWTGNAWAALLASLAGAAVVAFFLRLEARQASEPGITAP